MNDFNMKSTNKINSDKTFKSVFDKIQTEINTTRSLVNVLSNDNLMNANTRLRYLFLLLFNSYNFKVTNLEGK